MKYAAKLLSAILAFLALVKQSYEQLRKYLEQANIAAPTNIYFLINKSDTFIKNVDAPLAQYIASRQKKIAKLLEKNIFKIVTNAIM